MSIVGFIAALIPIGFNLVYSNPHTKNGTYWGETIHSWTCTWSFNGGKDSGDGTVVAVAGFARLCRETRASFALMCILLVLEFVLCVAAGAGWYLEVEMKKKREGIVSVAAAYAEEKPTDLFD